MMSIRFTRPEMALMTALQGLSFDTQVLDLPGTPDIVFPQERVVVFVHGCYWHRHFDCPIARIPTKNGYEWLRQFAKNTRRDQRVVSELRNDDWWVYVAWECEIAQDPQLVAQGIRQTLSRRSNLSKIA
jgi:DNA mismatch endonuclease (patch repair protein)